jgi:hypothetical protein
MALTNLGHALEHFNDIQQSLDNNHHDFSVRLLSEVTAKQEELALVDSLATAIERLDTQAFETNMASIKQLLKDKIALMHQAVSEIPELKDMLKLFDIANQLEFRLVQNEAGKVTIHFAEPAATTEVSEVEVAGEVGKSDNGRFGNKVTPAPSPSPTPFTPSPTATPPKNGGIDGVELIRFIIFMLGFPACVIFAGLIMCATFAFRLYICGVLVTPPPGKTATCDNFDNNNDSFPMAL